MKAAGVLTRIDNVLNGLGEHADTLEAEIEELFGEWDAINVQLSGGYDTHDRRISELKARIAQIDLELEEQGE
jgi:hypothetical protein